MKWAPALLALASAVTVSTSPLSPVGPIAPIGTIASCPILPATFEITNFAVGGVRGPVYTEHYGFNVQGNVGTANAACKAVNAGAGDFCDVAVHNVNETPCGDDFAFSFLESTSDSFTLVVNYTQPACGVTLIGCRRFLRSDITCVHDPTLPFVTYEKLHAPSRSPWLLWTMSASSTRAQQSLTRPNAARRNRHGK